MASNLIDPASIADALRKNVESYTPSIDREEVGRVLETDRDAQQASRNSTFGELVVGEACRGGGGRMTHQRLGATE